MSSRNFVKEILPFMDKNEREQAMMWARQENDREEVRACLCGIQVCYESLNPNTNPDAVKRARYIEDHMDELVEKYYLNVPEWEAWTMEYADNNSQGISDHLFEAMEYDGIWKEVTPMSMSPADYTTEYCPWCDTEAAIHSHGVTACPNCGKPLVPCSVCHVENGGCIDPCPYGCTGGPEDEHKPTTNPPMSPEEIAFALAHC